MGGRGDGDTLAGTLTPSQRAWFYVILFYFGQNIGWQAPISMQQIKCGQDDNVMRHVMCEAMAAHGRKFVGGYA